MTIVLRTVLLFATATPATEGGGPHWHTELDRALDAARQGGWPLAILFTNSKTCAACTLLERNVLGEPAFATLADRFAWLLVDGGGRSELDAAAQAAHDGLWQRFHAGPIPSLMLCDSAGVPFATVTGYDERQSPAAYAAAVARSAQTQAERDRLFALADTAADDAKAAALDGAFATLRTAFGKDWCDRLGDPVRHFYGARLAQFVALPMSDELRARYAADLAAHGRRRRLEAIDARLKIPQAEQDWDGVFAILDAAIDDPANADVRNELRLRRRTWCEWADRPEEGLTLAHVMLAEDWLDRQQRRSLEERVVQHLRNAGRHAEALAEADRLLATTHRGNAGTLHARIAVLQAMKRYADSAEAWKDYAAVKEVGSSRWQDAVYLRALDLRRAGRHRQAATELERLAGHESVEPWLQARSLAWAATERAEAGEPADAERALGEARKALAAAEVTGLRAEDRSGILDLVDRAEAALEEAWCRKLNESD